MKTAIAAVFTGVNRDFAIRVFPVTSPPAGMARLTLIASGICGTDLHIWKGKIPLDPPKIIGHEFVGRIAEISEADSAASGLRIGDSVIVDIACPCGRCALCRAGDDANCLNMKVTNGGDPDAPPHLYGGYAEVNYSPVQNLIRIPDGLDPKTAAVYACAGPTALHAFALAEQANCGIGQAKVAVVQGLGPVGTFAAAYLASLGIPRVLAVTAGTKPERDALARRLGVREVLSLGALGEDGVRERILAESDGIGADVVVEASGSPSAVPQGMSFLRTRGTYLIPGQYSNSGGVEIQPQLITFGALRLIGSSQYSLPDVAHYLEFLTANPQLHPVIRELITEYTVDRINDAYADIQQGKNIKTLLVPGN